MNVRWLIFLLMLLVSLKSWLIVQTKELAWILDKYILEVHNIHVYVGPNFVLVFN